MKTIKKRSLSELRQVKTYGYKPPVAKKVKERPLEKWEQKLSNKANNKSIKPFRYDKRRAIDCKLIKRSTTHKGYCKYMVTIGEKDGTIHKQPVYGKDMQDALSRLIKKELTVKVERKLETNIGLIFGAWLLVMGAPVIWTDHTSPWFLLYTFGSVVVLMLVAVWWYNHVNKGE